MDYIKRLKKIDYDKNYYHTIYKYKNKNDFADKIKIKIIKGKYIIKFS